MKTQGPLLRLAAMQGNTGDLHTHTAKPSYLPSNGANEALSRPIKTAGGGGEGRERKKPCIYFGSVTCLFLS